MSTEETTPVEPTEQNLDDFSAEFFERDEEKTEETTTSEEVNEEDVQEESDANEDTHADEDNDTLATDDDDETGEEEDSNKEDAPKPRKNRTQERIDELTGKWRDTERKLEEALAKLTEKENTPAEQPTSEVASEDTGPQPTDTNEDGTEKYPLGEYDPAYIKDLMKYTLDTEHKLREQSAKEQEEQRAREQAQAELQASWNEKLVPAQERYPDFQEKGQQLLGTFEGIDAAYGEYLTNTIMEMDYGPDVLYYLANNVDEAQKIVQSGAKKATISLGRLEAKFAFANEEKQKARPKVSSAPPPPGHLNKGSSAARPTIRGDEPDLNLDDFSRQFFKS